MELLKSAITQAPALVKIVYKEGAGLIILAVEEVTLQKQRKQMAQCNVIP